MDNVARPTFGRPSNAKAEPGAPETVEEFTPLRIHGTAVGHFVALIRAERGDAGLTLQVIVGREDADGAESVAIFSDDEDGKADAEATAFAILRSLEVLKGAMVGPT